MKKILIILCWFVAKLCIADQDQSSVVKPEMDVFVELGLDKDESIKCAVFVRTSSYSRIGISLVYGIDKLVFGNYIAPDISSEQQFDYQMLAINYRRYIWEDLYVEGKIGQFNVHKSLETRLTPFPDIIYLRSAESEGHVDITKTFASLSIGYDILIGKGVFLGINSGEYIMKGDSSGISVSTSSNIQDSSRNELHSAVSEYARKDFLSPPYVRIGITL